MVSMHFALVFSIVLSLVLTVVLNVVLRVFPGAGRRLSDGIERLADRSPAPVDGDQRRANGRVVFPWKLMLIGSLVLTVVINLVVLLSR